MRVFILLIVAVFSFLPVSGLAAEQEETTTSDQPVVERIGGTFLVSSIKKIKDGFRITFAAKDGTPRFKRLVLESAHVHVSVVEGAELRLSADVTATRGDTADVSQMVLFIPGRVGDTPVWMLSRRANQPVPPAKLIEMHAPSTDYQVF